MIQTNAERPAEPLIGVAFLRAPRHNVIRKQGWVSCYVGLAEQH